MTLLVANACLEGCRSRSGFLSCLPWTGVRVGLSALSLLNGALRVAKKKGFFKKCGIDSEIILVVGSRRDIASFWLRLCRARLFAVR